MSANLSIYCPAHIEFLIHCRFRPGPFPRIDLPLFSQLADDWLALGVIENAEDWTPTRASFRTTELGTAWLNSICMTKLPTVAFVNENGQLISP